MTGSKTDEFAELISPFLRRKMVELVDRQGSDSVARFSDGGDFADPKAAIELGKAPKQWPASTPSAHQMGWDRGVQMGHVHAVAETCQARAIWIARI